MLVCGLCSFLVILSYSVSGISGLCPERCICENVPVLVVNCSNQGLLEIPDLPEREVGILDLSHNAITDISSLTKGLFINATEIILDDNSIEFIPDSVFSGLQVHKLSIQNNRITTLQAQSFGDIQGFNSSSSVDLSGNPLHLIRGSAFAYTKGIGFILSGTQLTIEPYAFYGIFNISKIQIHDVQSLNIRPGAFTNAENVRRVDIQNAKINGIEGFTFQGLTEVKSLVLIDCVIRNIERYAFASIQYKGSHLNEIEPGRGGVVRLESCEIDVLPADCFRDTNIGSILVSGCSIGRIASHFTRGLTTLQSIRLTTNSIHRLSPQSLGSMVNLQELILTNNDLDEITGETFKGLHDIRVMKIQFNQDLIFRSESFSGVHDVGLLEISGDGHRVTFEEGAFSGLVGVQRMELTHLDIPMLSTRSLQGMSRIIHLRLSSCRIQEIRPGVFGGSSVGALDISENNQMQCDCVVLREFEHLFMNTTVQCSQSDGVSRRLNFNSRQPPLAVICPEASPLHSAASSLQQTFVMMCLFLLWLSTL